MGALLLINGRFLQHFSPFMHYNYDIMRKPHLELMSSRLRVSALVTKLELSPTKCKALVLLNKHSLNLNFIEFHVLITLRFWVLLLITFYSLTNM